MRRPLMWICICLVSIVAVIMYGFNAPPWDSVIPSENEGEEIVLTGQVYQKETRNLYGKEVLVLYLDSINISDLQAISDSIITSREKAPNHFLSNKKSIHKLICEVTEAASQRKPKLGEYVKVKGKLTSFSHATNPGEFDSANYYGILGIDGKVKNAVLLGISGRGGFSAGEMETRGIRNGSIKDLFWQMKESLYQVKILCKERLYKAFEERGASLLCKIMLGDGSKLDGEIKDLYTRNGIVHILAISGLHISMLGMGVYRALRRMYCPMKIAAFAGAVFILLYGFMTGFGVSVCRAVGMYAIHMLGEIKGRTYDMLTAMALLAVIMVLVNPRYLFHTGFLLSFLSVAAIGIVNPILQGKKTRINGQIEKRKLARWFLGGFSALRQGFFASLSVTIVTLPVQLSFFYQMPRYSVFLNLLVIPLMGVVMGAGIVGILFPSFRLPGMVARLIFDWYEWLCHWFESIPGSIWITGKPAPWKLEVYFGVLLLLICLEKFLWQVRKQQGKVWLSKEWAETLFRYGIFYVTLLVMIVFLGTNVREQNAIHFLDVGQGDCICIETKSGQVFLVDCGSSSRSNIGENVAIPFLKYRGIDKVDAIFVTHADKDHMNGVVELLGQSEITVGGLVLPNVGEKSRKDFDELLQAVERRNKLGNETGIKWLMTGDKLCMKELAITCLHPYAEYEGEGNEYSLCLLLEFVESGSKALLTGDVEGEGEEVLRKELTQRGIKKIDVLKIAHHGSRDSTSTAFLDELIVKTAIISCGENNRYGHPHKETLERLSMEGSKVYRTDESGWIVIGANLIVSTY